MNVRVLYGNFEKPNPTCDVVFLVALRVVKIASVVLLSLFSIRGFSYPEAVLYVADTSLKLQDQNLKDKKISLLILPAVLIGYGGLSFGETFIESADEHIHHEINEKYPRFSSNLESKIQHVPVLAVYGLDLLGVNGKSNFIDQTAMYAISNMLMSVSVDFLKDKTHRLRPSGNDTRSFPSGHTATAFVAAEFIRQEYIDQSPWYGYAGYAFAAATGTLRMLNREHWFSDVVTGAGIGVLSVRVTYKAYPWLKQKIFKTEKTGFILVPLVRPGQTGVYFKAPL